MRRRPLRDELRDVFDDLSEPAHPALSARIRHQVVGPPAPARVPRLAVAVAAVTALLVVAGLVLAGRHAILSPNPATTPAPASPAPAPSQTPVPVVPGPTAGATPSPAATQSGYSCAAQSGGGPAMPAPPSGVTMVRAAGQTGYDRFVIELNGPVPAFDVVPQPTAAFVQDPSGRTVTLAGSAGLKVTVHGAQASGSYTGSADLRPTGTATLEEARQVGDFEGVLTWGLGLSHVACFHAYVLTGPDRLVVDVQG